MKNNYSNIYQFKITLKGIKPPIWRRIQVPQTYSFWDLHVAIQNAMGWLDYHLHQFHVKNKATAGRLIIGIPMEEYKDIDPKVLPGWKYKIADYINKENETIDYEYDFGDSWQHLVKLEKILPREKGIEYPKCTGGKRACPPEDVGGIGGYEYFLEVINDLDNEEHDEILEWAGGRFDPEEFDIEAVEFEDPDERLKEAIEDE